MRNTHHGMLTTIWLTEPTYCMFNTRIVNRRINGIICTWKCKELIWRYNGILNGKTIVTYQDSTLYDPCRNGCCVVVDHVTCKRFFAIRYWKKTEGRQCQPAFCAVSGKIVHSVVISSITCFIQNIRAQKSLKLRKFAIPLRDFWERFIVFGFSLKHTTWKLKVIMNHSPHTTIAEIKMLSKNATRFIPSKKCT